MCGALWCWLLDVGLQELVITCGRDGASLRFGVVGGAELRRCRGAEVQTTNEHRAQSGGAGLGSILSTQTLTDPLTPTSDTLVSPPGPRMGVVQRVQVCGAADGAEHGVRARPAPRARELAQPGAYLHQVRLCVASMFRVVSGLLTVLTMRSYELQPGRVHNLYLNLNH